MSNKINTNKLPSSDWDWLEKNELWERKSAAAWFLPLGAEEHALKLMSERKQQHLTPMEQFGITAESLKGNNLRHLRGMGKLKKLRAPRSLDDEGMFYIGQLGKLKRLSLSGNGFTYEGINHLSSLTKLTSLSAEWLPPGAESIKTIANLPSLQSLEINETNLTDEDLIPLKDSGITSLALPNKNITGSCLKMIGQITTLEELRLGRIQLTNDDLKHLSGLTNLKRLAFYKNGDLTGGLVHLEPLKSLKKLRLDKEYCKTPEAKELKKKIPGLVIRNNV